MKMVEAQILPYQMYHFAIHPGEPWIYAEGCYCVKTVQEGTRGLTVTVLEKKLHLED